MRSPSVDVMSTEVLDSQQRGSVAATSPAERHSTPVDGVDVLGALSPSRAGDFMTCPLLYRFRTIDKLPEPASPDAVRGTLVHKVLEDLFELPALERTPVRAEQMLEPSWHRLLADEPGLAAIFEGDDSVDRDRWWDTCRTVLERYFTLEDPTRLEPAERELYVEWLLDSKLLLRGFVDRVDVAPDGAIRPPPSWRWRPPTRRNFPMPCRRRPASFRPCRRYSAICMIGPNGSKSWPTILARSKPLSAPRSALPGRHDRETDVHAVERVTRGDGYDYDRGNGVGRRVGGCGNAQ